MNRTEKYLKKLIDEMPESCHEFPVGAVGISSNLNVSANKQQKKRLLIKYITAIICVLFVTVSVPVMAQIPFLAQRMQTLSKDDMKNMEDMTNQQNAEADLFSRPLSNEERKRMELLRGEYEQGVFPNEDIPIISGTQQANADFYYNSDTGMFYLPDSRKLTDEELRQYIDFYYKRDYSLRAQQVSEEPASEEQERNEPDEDFTIPEKHMEIIQDWLTVYDIYHPDITNLKAEEMIVHSEDWITYTYSYQTDAGTLCFDIQNDDLVYLYEMESETADTDTEGTLIPKMQPLEQADNFESVKEALRNMSGIDCEISSAWYLCQSDPDGYLRYDAYAYLFANDKGEGWAFGFENGSAYPSWILPTTYDWWMENNRKGKQLEEFKGIEIEHNVIALDIETGMVLSEH